MPKRKLSRRGFVGAAGTATIVGLAGCADDEEDDVVDGDEEEDDSV